MGGLQQQRQMLMAAGGAVTHQSFDTIAAAIVNVDDGMQGHIQIINDLIPRRKRRNGDVLKHGRLPPMCNAPPYRRMGVAVSMTAIQ
jgi:hypothetical protein